MSRTRIGGLLVLLAAAWGGVSGCDKPKPRLAPVKPPVVIVSQPVSDYVADYEDFTGHIEAVYAISITARVSGQLERVHFKDGDEVKEGDLLFEIDPRPYKAELDRTEATLAQGEAHLKRLEADFRRINKLMSGGNVSREEYDKVAGDRAEGDAAVGIARASYDLAKLNMSYTRIAAPISGRLSRRLVDPGNLVKADETALTTIVSLDPVYVYFDVDERTLLRLRRLVAEKKIPSRREAEIAVLVALADETGFPHRGVIDFSDNKVDAATGTLRLRAKVPNPAPRLFSPGLFTRVRLPVGSPRKTIMVAEKALGTDQGQKYVYVVAPRDDKGKKVAAVVKRNVKVGKLEAGMREIEAGIDPGQWVVVEGLQRVRAGVTVDPKTEKGADAPIADGPGSATPVPDKKTVVGARG